MHRGTASTLALHDGETRLWTDVAEPQHASPVGYHGDEIGFGGVLENLFGIGVNRLARGGHTGRVPDGEIVDVADAAFGDDLHFAAIEGVKFHRIVRRL